MKLNVKAMALAAGIGWGVVVLVVGLAATYLGVKEGSYYGKEFALMVASIYPGYSGTPGVGNSVVGGLYGLVDGVICGGIFAWLYNRCCGCGCGSGQGTGASSQGTGG